MRVERFWTQTAYPHNMFEPIVDERMGGRVSPFFCLLLNKESLLLPRNSPLLEYSRSKVAHSSDDSEKSDVRMEIWIVDVEVSGCAFFSYFHARSRSRALL